MPNSLSALFSSHLQPQANLEYHELNRNMGSAGDNSKSSTNLSLSSSRIKKAPAKPRVYRCKECTVVFATLKLRRMHPCEQLKTANEMNPDMKLLNEENVSMPGSSRQDDGLALKTKPKKKSTRKPKATIKKEVIVDDQSSGQANFAPQYRISKAESEESIESRVRTQLLPAVLPSKSEENCGYEPAAVNLASEAPGAFISEEIQSSNTNQYTCEKCGQVSVCSLKFLYHEIFFVFVLIVVSLLPFQDFPSAKILFHHLSIKHRGQKYQCATCGESYEKEREYYDHLMIHPLECQECGKTFTR